MGILRSLFRQLYIAFFQRLGAQRIKIAAGLIPSGHEAMLGCKWQSQNVLRYILIHSILSYRNRSD